MLPPLTHSRSFANAGWPRKVQKQTIPSSTGHFPNEFADKCIPLPLYFLFHIFIELEFIYHTAPSFKVCHSMVFSTFRVMQPSLASILEHFHRPQKKPQAFQLSLFTCTPLRTKNSFFCIKHFSKHFICSISLNPYTNPWGVSSSYPHFIHEEFQVQHSSVTCPGLHR